jgi:hypothetical protein
MGQAGGPADRAALTAELGRRLGLPFLNSGSDRILALDGKGWVVRDSGVSCLGAVVSLPGLNGHAMIFFG